MKKIVLVVGLLLLTFGIVDVYNKYKNIKESSMIIAYAKETKFYRKSVKNGKHGRKTVDAYSVIYTYTNKNNEIIKYDFQTIQVKKFNIEVGDKKEFLYNEQTKSIYLPSLIDIFLTPTILITIGLMLSISCFIYLNEKLLIWIIRKDIKRL